MEKTGRFSSVKHPCIRTGNELLCGRLQSATINDIRLGKINTVKRSTDFCIHTECFVHMMSAPICCNRQVLTKKGHLYNTHDFLHLNLRQSKDSNDLSMKNVLHEAPILIT